MRLLEVLDERDDQGALSDEDTGHPRDQSDSLIAHCDLERLDCLVEIGFGGEGRRIQFFEGFGDAFGLRAGKAALFELLDDAVRVNHERLHMRSVYHLDVGSQG
jgi:hypothetical protein